MKTKIFTLLSFIIAGLAGAVLLLLCYGHVSQKIASTSSSGELSAEGVDEWNLMRLRDPKTGKIPDHIRQKELYFASQLPGALNNLHSKYDYILSDRWTRRGPTNIGGRTRALGVDIKNENIILAGGVSGGMWRSTDGGASWVKTTSPQTISTVTCLVQDTRSGKENTWYFGTGEAYGNSSGISGDGVYKSTDDGASWFPLTSTVSAPNYWQSQFDYIWNIVIDPTITDEDVIIAATALGGIYRSTDGGTNWSAVLGGFGNSYSYFSDIAISPKGVYYATMSQQAAGNATSAVKGIYRSTNGTDWANITPTSGFPQNYSRIVIGISPSDENQVYFLAVTPGSGKLTYDMKGDSLWDSFYKYTYLYGNGAGVGGKWEDRSQNLPKPDNLRGQFNPQGSYNLVVKVMPDNPDIVFIGGTNLYRSTDGFATSGNTSWIGGYDFNYVGKGYAVYPNQHPDQHAIEFLPSDEHVMFTGSDGGVAKTQNDMADTVQWTSLNNGYYTTQFYSVALDHGVGGDHKIVGGLQDNETLFTNTDDLNTGWTDLSMGDGLGCAIANNGSFYITSQNSLYQPNIIMWKLKVNEADGSIITKTRIDPIGGKDFIWMAPFQLDPNNNNILYLGGGRIIWRNNDLSSIPDVNSNDSISTGWDSLSNSRVDTTITALQVSKNPANILYYGTCKGRVFKILNANTDNPQAVEITGTHFPLNAYVSSIAIDPFDANKVIVSFSNYNVESIYYTTDGGTSWAPISGNLEEYPGGGGSGPGVLWVEILQVGSNNMYFAGTTTGIYSTAYLDGSYTVWQQEGANSTGNTVVDMLDSRSTDGVIVAGTHGAGVFSANINSIPINPEAPVLVSPFDNQRGIKLNTDLTWDPVGDAVFYKVQIADEPGFVNIYYEKDGITGTTITTPDLEQGKIKYYWRVLARNSGGPGNYSDVWTFTTALLPPVLIFPANLEDSLPYDVNLQWANVDGADSYHLQISESFLFSNLILDTNGIMSNTYELKNLKPDKKYYWRLSSFDSDGEGTFSKAWYFRTAPLTAVKESNEYDFNLGQNYPNPFSTITAVQFSLNRKSNVKLIIYDYLGNQVKIVIDKQLGSGSYNINIDSKGLNTGKYFYKLISGKHEETKSMVVIR